MYMFSIQQTDKINRASDRVRESTVGQTSTIPENPQNPAK